MMKRTIVPMFVVACCTVAFAQTPDSAKQEAMKGMKPGAVTVTGCVAEGSPAGHFMLNNAMMATDSMKPDAMKKESSSMPATGDKMAAASYMLVGGENLKAHVGHKVEVTGTVGMAGKMDAPTAAGAKDAMKSKSPELTVQSVKMVSATCP